MSEDFMRNGEPPPLPPPPPPVVYSRPPKNPAAATLLSLFPGLGQVYNGQPAKALVFFVAWAGSIAATKNDPMPFAMMIPFIYFYNLIDAWRSASSINRRAQGGVRVPEEDAAESPAWGASLMLLGFVLLLRNLGWIDFHALARYWPLLLIAAGGALLYGSLQRKGNGGHAGL